MITTVHEDDLAAWYHLPEAVENISICDFELEDDDLLQVWTSTAFDPL